MGRLTCTGWDALRSFPRQWPFPRQQDGSYKRILSIWLLLERCEKSVPWAAPSLPLFESKCEQGTCIDSPFTDSSGLMKSLKAFMHDLLIQIAVILRAILHLSNENSRRIWARKRKAISQLKKKFVQSDMSLWWNSTERSLLVNAFVRLQ